MPKFKKVSADEFMSKRKDHVRGDSRDAIMVKGFKSPKSWNPDERSATFIMTTETPDRYKDIVDQAGLSIDRFLDNPQGLLFHNSRSWPCGSWSDVTKVLNGRPKRTEGKLTFLPEGTDEDADRAARHVAAGVLRTVSIGFIPDWEQIEWILDDEDEWTGGFRYGASELIECSLVPIPAQPDALVKGIEELSLARELIEEVLDTYAKTPEGLLIPLADYEKAYKTVVEKIADDATAPAPAAAEPEVKGDEAETEAKDGDEPECEPMEEAEKAFTAFVAKLEADDVLSLDAGLVETEPRDGYRCFVKSETGGTFKIKKTDGTLLTLSLATLPAKHTEIAEARIAELKAAHEAENKQATPEADTIVAQVTKANEGLLERVFEGIAALFRGQPPVLVQERAEPTIVEPPAPPTPEQIAAAKAGAAETLKRLAEKGLIEA